MDEAWLIPSEAVGLLLVLSWINQAELSSLHIGSSQFIWSEMGYFHFTFQGLMLVIQVHPQWVKPETLILILLNSSFSTWLALCPTLGDHLGHTDLPRLLWQMITNRDKTRENHPLMVWRLDIQGQNVPKGIFSLRAYKEGCFHASLTYQWFNEFLGLLHQYDSGLYFLWLSYPYVLHISFLLYCLLDLESLYSSVTQLDYLIICKDTISKKAIVKVKEVRASAHLFRGKQFKKLA